jgi:transposase
MLTREEDIEAHALYSSGWKISAIARHLGRDRKTIRGYVTGARTPGVRARNIPDAFEAFVEYVRARLVEDPHLWVTTLADELEPLGWSGGYSTLTRQIRRRGLRPVCEQCRALKDRPVAIIDHPGGAETQWDWVELPDPPAHWGWGRTAHLLVGASSHSGAWRGVLAESEDQAHLVVGLHQVASRLGGLTRAWRFDRMATVADPGSGRVSATFAAVAKHYLLTEPTGASRQVSEGVSSHELTRAWC